ncbi:hypothetical protein [Pseudanabaena sp. ABRG5-3]|uniref:hypothetical protein n=1 Tax=Pseudanabaena sp. ABRG5-3 TaxID=685565 RepID=UPI000DC6EE64|nr:hypothetical protein [Pseudanabaena sp. ABRG5-3]BBC24429.1 hypothetical protein ABRG53_2172 [Pseudanabaena sp. ABRG5-3]
MMYKLLSGAALAATVIAANVLPLSANPTTNLKTGNTLNSVSPKSSLIEIEGRTLTDVEAAKVEGEKFWFAAVPAVVGAVGGFGFNTVRNVQNGRPWHQSWAQSTGAGAVMATCGAANFATRGGTFMMCSGPNLAASSHLRSRW